LSNPDLEDVIDACKTVFEEQFPDYLMAVDARKSTPLNPKPPVKTYFGDIQNIPDMPALLFTGHDTGEEEDESDWRRQIYTLEIEAYYTHSDVQTLSRLVRRYGAAIDETLRKNQTLGGISSEITNIRQKYFDTMQRGAGLLQAMVTTFDVIVMTN
jgi:hypothetical protein